MDWEESRPFHTTPLAFKYCLYDRKPFTSPPNAEHKKFCSKACQKAYWLERRGKAMKALEEKEE